MIYFPENSYVFPDSPKTPEHFLAAPCNPIQLLGKINDFLKGGDLFFGKYTPLNKKKFSYLIRFSHSCERKKGIL